MLLFFSSQAHFLLFPSLSNLHTGNTSLQKSCLFRRLICNNSTFLFLTKTGSPWQIFLIYYYFFLFDFLAAFILLTRKALFSWLLCYYLLVFILLRQTMSKTKFIYFSCKICSFPLIPITQLLKPGCLPLSHSLCPINHGVSNIKPLKYLQNPSTCLHS